jgi:hypothetical protein
VQRQQLHTQQSPQQQSWSDQAQLWQSQQHIPVAAATVSAAAIAAATGVSPPQPFYSYSSQQSSSCPQLSQLSPPLIAKQQQLVQLRQQNASLSSSPYCSLTPVLARIASVTRHSTPLTNSTLAWCV